MSGAGPGVGLTVLKYASLSVTMVYGIVATLVDFRVERDGERRFSRWGYFGIGLLLVSSVLGLTLEWRKDRQEARAAFVSDSTSRVRDSAAAAAQQAVLVGLREQLRQLRELQGTSARALALGDTQLGQQTRLLDVQQGVAFNASRALYREPRVAHVSAELVYRWDASQPGADAGNRSVRAHAHRVAEAVDSLCRRWDAVHLAWRRSPIGQEQMRSDTIARFIDDDGDGWSWAPSRGEALAARFLAVHRREVVAFGVRHPAGAACTADSVHVGAGSPWLELAPRRVGRDPRVDSLGTAAFELTLAGDAADSTAEALRVPVRTDAATTAERQAYDNRVLVVDFVHATLRRSLSAVAAAEPIRRTDRVVSLLDLPGTLLAVSAPELSAVPWLRVDLDGGRQLTIPGAGFRRLPDGRFAHAITVADIERTPGEFAALFPARGNGRVPARGPRATAGRAPAPVARRSGGALSSVGP